MHRKRAVSSQTSELEALEARLRETEERLKAKQAVASDPTRRHSGMGSPRTRQALGDTFNRRQDGEGENRSPSSPLAATHENTKTPSRPPTGGAMPPTPGASEGEYVFVDRESAIADHVAGRKDGDIPATEAES